MVFEKKETLVEVLMGYLRYEHFLSLVLNMSQAEVKLYLINKEKYTTA